MLLLLIKTSETRQNILREQQSAIALASTPVQTGTVREVFAVNQLSHLHKVEYSKQKGDFRIDSKYTIEVGGAGKTFKQIADVPMSYIFADDIENPDGNKLPLWLLGFLY